MSDLIEMTGRLLIFDKPGKTNVMIPRDCELLIPSEKFPVLWEFNSVDPSAVKGFASVTQDDTGLICDVWLTNFDRDLLRDTFHDELYIGGCYNNIKRHVENGVTVIDKARLLSIGITLSPADDEMKMVVKQ